MVVRKESCGYNYNFCNHNVCVCVIERDRDSERAKERERESVSERPTVLLYYFILYELKSKTSQCSVHSLLLPFSVHISHPDRSLPSKSHAVLYYLKTIRTVLQYQVRFFFIIMLFSFIPIFFALTCKAFPPSINESAKLCVCVCVCFGVRDMVLHQTCCRLC